MHRTQLAKTKNPKPDFSDFSVFRFLFDCLDTAKLFTNSKFCINFVTLIPVMNYYTQIAFKREPTMTTYGYARVSTNGQDLGSQEAELMAAGAAKVFKEKVSGAKTDRAELAKLIRRLEPGDVLIVTRLDRLARSTRDLLNVLATVGEGQAGFRSLKDTWADTTTAHGRLMLTVLGGLAEFASSTSVCCPASPRGRGWLRTGCSISWSAGASPRFAPSSRQPPSPLPRGGSGDRAGR
jgi:hypothetical protein